MKKALLSNSVTTMHSCTHTHTRFLLNPFQSYSSWRRSLKVNFWELSCHGMAVLFILPLRHQCWRIQQPSIIWTKRMHLAKIFLEPFKTRKMAVRWLFEHYVQLCGSDTDESFRKVHWNWFDNWFTRRTPSQNSKAKTSARLFFD